MVDGGVEPTHRIRVLEEFVSNPRCGTATMGLLLLIAIVLNPLNASNATMNCPVAMLVALPRKLSTRRVTPPDAGVVKLTPFKLTVCGEISCAVKATGTCPAPVSAVTTISLGVPGVSRLVIGTDSEI